jgi:hypothetical protein
VPRTELSDARDIRARVWYHESEYPRVSCVCVCSRDVVPRPSRTAPDADRGPPVSGAPNVNRQPVESSLIRSVGYDLEGSVLEVEFVEGDRVYQYYDVPLSVYSELMDAESKGIYFNEYIRDMYSYSKFNHH